jgi:LAO/AO transport system kinase
VSRVEQVLAGEVRAAARLMRDLDDRLPSAIEELKALYPHCGKAFIIGITGNPGAGKSTLVDSLIGVYRKAGLKVGVVAVDPTSPFSGGAILGDRIRMQRHAGDSGVFIRSLATRGQLGGLSRSTFDVVSVLDAMGYERIIIETVGVGQDEIEIMKTAHTSVVITVPGLGDDIQAIKAGILEIADVLVVNKADREGADRAIRDLIHMLDLRGRVGRQEVEIVKSIATLGMRPESGIAEVARAIDAHRERSQIESAQRELERAMAHIAELVRGLLADRAARALAAQGGLAELAQNVVDGVQDPYTAAESVVEKL